MSTHHGKSGLRAWHLAAAAALVLLVACGGAPTGDTAVADSSSAAPQATATTGPSEAQSSEPNLADTTGNAALVSYFDPETGKLTSRPPEGGVPVELRAAGTRSLAGSHQELEYSVRPDGMKILRKPGGFRTALVATRTADGRIEVKHVPGDGHATIESAGSEEGRDEE